MKTLLSALVLASVFSFISIAPTASQAQGWAVEVGPSYNIQKGTFIAPCGCTFADGVGLGFIGAVSASILSFEGFSIGLSTGVELQKFTSHEVDPATLMQIANGDDEEIKLAYVSVDPYLRFQVPTTGLFFQVSPGVEYLVSSSFSHLMGAASEDTASTLDHNAPIDVRKASYHAKVSVGYSFGFLGMAIEPTIYAKQPLTDLTLNNAKEWHVTTLYASLALRFGL